MVVGAHLLLAEHLELLGARVGGALAVEGSQRAQARLVEVGDPRFAQLAEPADDALPLGGRLAHLVLDVGRMEQHERAAVAHDVLGVRRELALGRQVREALARGPAAEVAAVRRVPPGVEVEDERDRAARRGAAQRAAVGGAPPLRHPAVAGARHVEVAHVVAAHRVQQVDELGLEVGQLGQRQFLARLQLVAQRADGVVERLAQLDRARADRRRRVQRALARAAHGLVAAVGARRGHADAALAPRRRVHRERVGAQRVDLGRREPVGDDGVPVGLEATQLGRQERAVGGGEREEEHGEAVVAFSRSWRS